MDSTPVILFICALNNVQPISLQTMLYRRKGRKRRRKGRKEGKKGRKGRKEGREGGKEGRKERRKRRVGGKGGRKEASTWEEFWKDGNVSLKRLYCYTTHMKVENSKEEEKNFLAIQAIPEVCSQERNRYGT